MCSRSLGLAAGSGPLTADVLAVHAPCRQCPGRPSAASRRRRLRAVSRVGLTTAQGFGHELPLDTPLSSGAQGRRISAPVKRNRRASLVMGACHAYRPQSGCAPMLIVKPWSLRSKANATYQQDFVMLIITTDCRAALIGFNCEFLLPVAQHAGLDAAQLADFAYGEVTLGRDRGQDNGRLLRSWWER